MALNIVPCCTSGCFYRPYSYPFEFGPYFPQRTHCVQPWTKPVRLPLAGPNLLIP